MLALAELRADFEHRARRSLSLPVAGAIVWSAAALLGSFFPPGAAMLALLFGTGAIFPVALLIARLRGEQLIENTNPLARLMDIALALKAPAFVPLSVGIGLRLHWVVYSRITQHPVGYAHATLRTLGVLAAWWMFPQAVVSACAAAVVVAYALAIYQLATRRIPALDAVR